MLQVQLFLKDFSVQEAHVVFAGIAHCAIWKGCDRLACTASYRLLLGLSCCALAAGTMRHPDIFDVAQAVNFQDAN